MTEKQTIERWVHTWREHGPELEKIRLREIRDEDTRLSLQILEGAFNHATNTATPDLSPGMIEMQRLFAKLAKK